MHIYCIHIYNIICMKLIVTIPVCVNVHACIAMQGPTGRPPDAGGRDELQRRRAVPPEPLINNL